MRPDYTLSIWPEPFTAREAEEQELMAHLHFDAKYKIEQLGSAFESEEEEDNQNNLALQSDVGKAKSTDIHKMHAYKDAIRRTEGAYILYPGSEKCNPLQYHELLPGVGAFPLRPGREKEDIRQLSQFLYDVLENLCDRASRREMRSYYTYSAQHRPSEHRLSILMPEISPDGERTPLPDEHFVMAVPVDHPGIKRKKESGKESLLVPIERKGHTLLIASRLASLRHVFVYDPVDTNYFECLKVTNQNLRVTTLKRQGGTDDAPGHCDDHIQFEVEPDSDFYRSQSDIISRLSILPDTDAVTPAVFSLSELLGRPV